MTSDDARALYARAREQHAARDIAGSIDLAREALALDPAYADALEHLATLLVTRRRAYDEGLTCIERATDARPDDAGLWYTRGWLEEFAAHELARAGGDRDAVRAHYERAADAFRRCLSLHPEGKLQGDAEDLLDHVENQLS
jgi:tetratricopeptide (TPR) repeat protein